MYPEEWRTLYAQQVFVQPQELSGSAIAVLELYFVMASQLIDAM